MLAAVKTLAGGREIASRYCVVSLQQMHGTRRLHGCSGVGGDRRSIGERDQISSRVATGPGILSSFPQMTCIESQISPSTNTSKQLTLTIPCIHSQSTPRTAVQTIAMPPRLPTRALSALPIAPCPASSSSCPLPPRPASVPQRGLHAGCSTRRSTSRRQNPWQLSPSAGKVSIRLLTYREHAHMLARTSFLVFPQCLGQGSV